MPTGLWHEAKPTWNTRFNYLVIKLPLYLVLGGYDPACVGRDMPGASLGHESLILAGRSVALPGFAANDSAGL